MCRWAAYRGAPVFIEELVSSPAHSLVAQSPLRDDGPHDDECPMASALPGMGIDQTPDVTAMSCQPGRIAIS